MTKIKGGVGTSGFFTPVNRVCTCGVECNGPVGCYHDYEFDDDGYGLVDTDDEDIDPYTGEPWPEPEDKDPDGTEITRLRDLLERVLELAANDGMIDMLNQNYTCMEIEDLITKEL